VIVSLPRENRAPPRFFFSSTTAPPRFSNCCSSHCGQWGATRDRQRERTATGYGFGLAANVQVDLLRMLRHFCELAAVSGSTPMSEDATKVG
jgi:hypothetical protein